MQPITVIIITHNRVEYTKRTINSLLRTVPYANFIVYDNDSDEGYFGLGMFEYLNSLDKEKFRVIFSTNNDGWGSAVNFALTCTIDTEMILISNNDVEYKDGWFEKLLDLYEKYPQIGIMGVWKHQAHGVHKDYGDMEERDDMPAVGWLMKKSIIDDIGNFPERGPCATKGGNGEDSHYVNMAKQKGYLICAPKEDVAIHIDGY